MAELPPGIDPNNVPALEPPTGETSNLVNPYNINKYMYITACIGLGLSMLAVVIRILAKRHVMRTIQLEELVLLLSQCGFVAFVGLMIRSTKLGQGTHQWNVSVAHFQKVVELANIIEVIYCPIIMGAKVSLLLQLRRVFIVAKKGWMYWLHQIIFWATVLAYLGLMLSLIFPCVPREKLWNPSIPGHCQSTSASLIGSSVVNVVSDVTCFIMPLVVIVGLQLPKKTKVVLSIVFGTVILGLITSIIRLVYTVKLTQTDDFTWAIMPVGLWAIAEIASIILAGSIPLLPGLIKFVRNQSSGTGGHSSRVYWHSRAPPSNNQQHSNDQKNIWDQEQADSMYNNKHDAHISTSSLVHHGDSMPLGVLKTVEIQTTHVPAYS